MKMISENKISKIEFPKKRILENQSFINNL